MVTSSRNRVGALAALVAGTIALLLAPSAGATAAPEVSAVLNGVRIDGEYHVDGGKTAFAIGIELPVSLEENIASFSCPGAQSQPNGPNHAWECLFPNPVSESVFHVVGRTTWPTEVPIIPFASFDGRTYVTDAPIVLQQEGSQPGPPPANSSSPTEAATTTEGPANSSSPVEALTTDGHSMTWVWWLVLGVGLASIGFGALLFGSRQRTPVAVPAAPADDGPGLIGGLIEGLAREGGNAAEPGSGKQVEKRPGEEYVPVTTGGDAAPDPQPVAANPERYTLEQKAAWEMEHQPTEPWHPLDPLAMGLPPNKDYQELLDNARATEARLIEIYQAENDSSMVYVNAYLDGVSESAEIWLTPFVLIGDAFVKLDALVKGHEVVHLSGHENTDGGINLASGGDEKRILERHLAEVRQYLSRYVTPGGADAVNQAAQQNDLAANFGSLGETTKHGVGTAGSETGRQLTKFGEESGLGGGGSKAVIPPRPGWRPPVPGQPTPSQPTTPAAKKPDLDTSGTYPALPRKNPDLNTGGVRPAYRPDETPAPPAQPTTPAAKKPDLDTSGTYPALPRKNPDLNTGGVRPAYRPDETPAPPQREPEPLRPLTPEEQKAWSDRVNADVNEALRQDAERAAQGLPPAFPGRATFLPREQPVPPGRESPGAPPDPNSPVLPPMSREQIEAQQRANEAYNRGLSSGPQAGTANRPDNEAPTRPYGPGQREQAQAETSPRASAPTRRADPPTERDLKRDAPTTPYSPAQVEAAKAETSPRSGDTTRFEQHDTTLITPGPVPPGNARLDQQLSIADQPYSGTQAEANIRAAFSQLDAVVRGTLPTGRPPDVAVHILYRQYQDALAWIQTGLAQRRDYWDCMPPVVRDYLQSVSGPNAIPESRWLDQLPPH